MINIYGLKNCDGCRKALKWLDKNNYFYNFFDFKDLTLSGVLLLKWIEVHSLEKILNKRSMLLIQAVSLQQLSSR